METRLSIRSLPGTELIILPRDRGFYCHLIQQQTAEPGLPVYPCSRQRAGTSSVPQYLRKLETEAQTNTEISRHLPGSSTR
jgi:hypothetical protein